MLAPSFVANIARTLYGFEPQLIESLDQYQFDWRGIYQLGSYVADATLAQHPDFPFGLEKLHARYQATQPIAEIAARYFV